MQEPVTSAKNLTLLDAVVHGLLIPPREHDELIEAVRTFIGRYESFSGYCRDHRAAIAREFDEGTMITNVAQVYARLLGDDGR